jgi:TonB-dependent receptor
MRLPTSSPVLAVHVAAACGALAAAPAAAQQSGVAGTVTTVEGRPLPSVQLRLAGGALAAPRTAVTGSDGRFVLPRVPAGRYTLTTAYIGYRPAEQTVTVEDGRTAAVTLRLEASAVRLGAVEVLGAITEGQAKALNEQKNSPNVASVVSQEQIQRFPDRNAAEAVQRIPGVSVQREEGEGELVQIRGLSAELNAVTINGQRAPSANPRFGESANQRATSLETLQADIVQAVKVSKALTPDLDGDAIGGQIEFRLATAPERGRAEFEVGYGPANAPNLDRAPGYGDGIGNARATLGRRFLGDRFGVLLNGSYFRNDRGTVMEQDYFLGNDPANPAQFTTVNRVRREDRDFRRRRYGGVGSADYRFNDRHELRLAVTGNRFASDEIRRRVDFRTGSNGQNDNFIRNHEEARWLGTADASGRHGLGAATLAWSAAVGRGEEEQPDRVIFNFRRNVPQLTTASTDAMRALRLDQAFAPNYALRFVEHTPMFHREDTKQGRLDLTLPLPLGARRHEVAVGAKHLRRDKLFEPRYFQHRPAAGQTIAIGSDGFGQVADRRFGSDAYATFALRRNADGSPLLEEDKARGRYTEYDADEDVSAGYAMGTFQLGGRLTALVGSRVERTDIRMRTLQPRRVGAATVDDTVHTPRAYTNVLPSAHFTWRLGERSNVRAAFSTGLARPDYFALVDSRYVNEEADSILGNPNLRPTRARNLDLFYEVYGSDVSFLTAGAFAKRLVDPIARTRRPYNNQGGEVLQSINGRTAEIYGVEVAGNYRLTRLPDALALLRPFGVYATYSYARTEAVYDIGDQERALPFVNTPAHTANLALTFDDRPRGLQLTLSGNYRGSRLDEIGSAELTDIYYRDETTLDFSGAWRFWRGTELVVRANNLLDTPERRTFGDPAGEQWRARFRETYGRTFSVGARYTY